MELTGPSENSSCLLSELHNYFPQTCGWTSTCYAHEIQFMQMLLEGLIIKRRWPPELEEKYSFNQIPLFNRRFYGDNGSERQEHSSTSTLLKKGHASIPALFPLIACGLKTITDIQTHTYENGHTQTHTERRMHPLPSISVPILFSFFASIAQGTSCYSATQSGKTKHQLAANRLRWEGCNGSYTLKYSAISEYSSKYLNPL